MRFTTHFSILVAPVAALLVFGFVGCTKYIEFEGDNATPRLVVNGLMSPDSLIEVTLSNSVGYLSEAGIERQENGVLSLRNSNGELIEVLQHTGNGVYRANTPAEAGASYFLEVDHPGFNSVSAMDQVPQPVPILSLDTSTVETENLFESNAGLEFRFTFADPPGEDNFYLLEVFQRVEFFVNFIFDPNTGESIPDTVFYPEPIWENAFMNSSDQVIASDNGGFLGEAQSFGSQFYFSDLLFEGSTREFAVRASSGIDGSTQFLLRLSSLSESYFLYRQSLRSYDNTNGDPFAQPVQVYTNVEGGLGLFGAVSFDERLVE